jgi:hypothetical protein
VSAIMITVGFRVLEEDMGTASRLIALEATVMVWGQEGATSTGTGYTKVQG